MSGPRRLLLALSWIAAAAAGFLAAWLLRAGAERVVVIVHDGAGPSTAAAAGRSATGPNVSTVDTHTAGGGVPAAPASPGEGPSPPPGEVPAGAAPPAPASLRVTVFNPDGTRADGGTVYALSPGEKGLDGEEDNCRAAVGEDGTALLVLPLAGIYDVGYVFDARAVLAEDVRVPAGDGATLTLRLPGDTPIHARCDPPWPPPGVVDPRVVVFLAGPEEGTVRHPGRGQRAYEGDAIEIDSEGAGTSGLLPSGRTYSVSAAVQETYPQFLSTKEEDRRTPMPQHSIRFVAVPDHDTAKPGDTVRVGVRPVAPLVVDIAGDPRPTGPGSKENAIFARVTFVQGATRLELTQGFAGPREEGALHPRLLFTGEAGPCRLEWTGYSPGIREGAKTDIVLRAGEFNECAITIEGDPGAAATPVPPVQAETAPADPGPEVAAFEVTVEGLPAGGTVHLLGIGRDEEGRETGGQVSTDFDEGRVHGVHAMELGEDWRAFTTITAATSPFLLSEPVAVPRAGPVTLVLRPAGLLMVAPAEVWPASFGRLRLRLADGRPILRSRISEGEMEFFDASPDAAVSAGDLLGPLPEGTIAFQVRLGGVRLPDATATVRAGRIEVLRIQR